MSGDGDPYRQAADMLEAFGSVGASRFDVTWTSCAGEKQRYRPGLHLADLSRSLRQTLDQATRQSWNVIVRPCPPPVFLQLDDLDAAGIDRVMPLAFLTLDTSPGNHQAWFALAGQVDPDLARRVRKGAGADPTASGATRIAGSLNFKDKYAPDFPRVRIGHLAPQRMTTAAELERLGLVAPAEPVRQARPASYRPQGERKWPDYQRCLDGAPLNHAKTGPDTSRADFTWCMVASDWGWSIEDTARRLMDESGKARENGDGYAMVTARKAADAAARRTGTPATRPTGPRIRP